MDNAFFRASPAPSQRRSSQCIWPEGPDFDAFAYMAITLLHVRPFDPLQIDLLHCLYDYQEPIDLQALAVLAGWSTTTVVWFLDALLQHGMVKRLPLPRVWAEEKGAAR